MTHRNVLMLAGMAFTAAAIGATAFDASISFGLIVSGTVCAFALIWDLRHERH